jgi:hypothetical protein
MKVGDLVNPFWSSETFDPRPHIAELGLCVYLGIHRLCGGESYYTLLSSDGRIEIPAWHWKLEVIGESR